MQVNSIFQSLQQGILICDRHANVMYMNEAYGAFIGHSLAEIKGKKITDYREHALAPQVIQTGEAVEGIIRREGDQEYFASIYPIIEGGEVRGSVSVVTTLVQHQLKVNLHKLTLAERVRKFEKQEIEATVSYYGGGVEAKKKAAKDLDISLATLYNKTKEEA